MTSRPDPPGSLIDSDARLLQHWRNAMGEGGFGVRTLWLVFLDRDDHTLPVIVPIEDIPRRPEPGWLDDLMAVVGLVRRDEPGLGLAALLSRPGPATKSLDDRTWARDLVRAARRHGVRMWPVHLATADEVQVMAADDLIGVG